MTDTTIEVLAAAAAVLGTADGEAGGSWVFDGNTTVETARQCIAMDDDGDSEWFDHFGGRSDAPLSGEFADGPTVRTVLAELGASSVDGSEAHVDAVAEAYETAYADAFRAEVLRAARAIVAD